MRHTRSSQGGEGRAATVPPALIATGVAFLLVIAYLIGASFARRTAPAFVPSPIDPRPLPRGATADDTVTVDARNPSAWRFVDFDRRSEVMPPDTAGWDVAVRRFHVIAAAAIADLGNGALDTLRHVTRSGYEANTEGRDTTNGAIGHWYDYNFLTHLLEPGGHVYGVRTREGRYAAIEILSYYCPGLEAGCLTMRYRYPVPAGYPATPAVVGPGGRPETPSPPR